MTYWPTYYPYQTYRVTTQQPTKWGLDPFSNRYYRDKNGSRVYYSIREKIGEGAASNVHRLVPDRLGLKDKAIKISKGSSFEMEVANFSSIGGNFTGITKKHKFGNRSVIIMSKYETNLCGMIPNLTPSMQKKAIDQLIQGVKVLHEKGLFHRDITIHNVFYSRKGDFHLGDFGYSYRSYGDRVHDVKGLGVILRSILLKERYIPSNNTLRPLTEKDIPTGLPGWLADLTNCTETKFRTINEVVDYYNQQTRLDRILFFN